MNGPKRGITLDKEEEREKKTILKLIDGAVDDYSKLAPCEPFTNRINGDGGAVVIMLVLVYEARKGGHNRGRHIRSAERLQSISQRIRLYQRVAQRNPAVSWWLMRL